MSTLILLGRELYALYRPYLPVLLPVLFIAWVI